ncbi:MAG: 2-C-methyl-D-erythritol 2,4-cyclodiphosphate synthase [Nitrospiria bacterium]
MKIGIGYDVHQLVPGRPLIIGGILIPFEKGLLGHSDGDVLIHAVADALLGGLGLGDIGHYYPDTNPKYKGMPSLVILDDLRELLVKHQLGIENLDTIIIAQEPKMAPFMPRMKSIFAKHLHIEEKKVNIKAKTAEKLDAIGRGEGIAAHAACILSRLDGLTH